MSVQTTTPPVEQSRWKSKVTPKVCTVECVYTDMLHGNTMVRYKFAGGLFSHSLTLEQFMQHFTAE